MQKLMFGRLFSKGYIGSMTLKNRIVMPPMGTGLSTPEEGRVTDALKDYYEARAAGGAGLIIVEASCVEFPRAKNVEGMLAVSDDALIPGLSALADRAHRHDARIAVQIFHAGGEARPILAKTQPVAPSPVMPPPWYFRPDEELVLPRELTVPEIKEMEERFAEAALRAKKAGFDGVEIHANSRYLFTQFLAPAWNKRQDEYGGSLENRARFLLETIQIVRSAVGDDYPVWCRLICSEFGVEGGMTIEEAVQVAQMVEKAGLDAINVGVFLYGVDEKVPPPTGVKPGSMVRFAEAIKQAVNIPVIVSGGIDPHLGEKILAEGRTDFVGIGRGLIADSELPNKAKAGTLDEIRPCINCYRCVERVAFEGNPLRCSVNAATGREGESVVRSSTIRKKVMVFGGGVAGMEAARVAALRGHEVVLVEKQNRVGGQMNVAQLPPHKESFGGLVDYLELQMQKRGVRVNLGEAVTAEILAAEKPDVAILAAGATPLIPEVPGLETIQMCLAEDVLTGKTQTGSRVVILGGGRVGCETAEFLLEQRKTITILEMLESLPEAMNLPTGKLLLARILAKGAVLLKGATIEGVSKSHVEVTLGDGGGQSLEADTLVPAVGYSPDLSVLSLLKEKVAEVHQVGDNVRPRGIAEAVEEGFRVGLAI